MLQNIQILMTSIQTTMDQSQAQFEQSHAELESQIELTDALISKFNLEMNNTIFLRNI